MAFFGQPAQSAINNSMEHSYQQMDDEILAAVESLFGPEIWDDPSMMDKAKTLQAAGLNHTELQWTINNHRLPSNFTDIFK